jgi:hypothetical protein
MDPEEELAAQAGLDLALDELAAGRDVPTGPVGGGTAALASLAAELRAAVPPPPPGASERGRAAFLARAGGRRARGTTWPRPLPLRLAAGAAALVVVVALPAAARQARPGTVLWPVREAGQQVRDRLAADPVQRTRLRLNTAASYLAAGLGAGGERGKDMADRAEEKVKDALDALDDVAGPEAAAQRARARQLLARVEALRHQRDAGGRSGPGSGSGGGSSGSGGGGGDPAGDDDRGGSGSGGGSGNSGSGSVSGSGSSGSRRSGSGHG